MGWYEESKELERKRLFKTVNATVYRDRVEVCGQTIKRPASIAPSQWIEIWESLR